MTTPGGEDAGGGEALAGGGPASPTPLWMVLSAWGAAIVMIVVLGGLAALTFQASLSQSKALGDWVERTRTEIGAAQRARESELLTVVVQPLPGTPPALPSGPGETSSTGVMISPVWLERPMGEFPELAQRRGVESGSVELQCPVGPDGRIPSCWILNETPTGAGFAEAALIGAVNARLEPRTVDGVPTEAMVRFTTRFKLE